MRTGCFVYLGPGPQRTPAVANLAHTDQRDTVFGQKWLDLAGAEEGVFLRAIVRAVRPDGLDIAGRIEVEGEKRDAFGHASDGLAVDTLCLGSAIPRGLEEKIEHRITTDIRRVHRQRELARQRRGPGRARVTAFDAAHQHDG